MLLPDLMPTFTIAPGFQPYSAPGFCSVLNSSMASMGSMVPASPAAMTAFIMLCAIHGSLLSMPSTMKKLSCGRPPLVLWLQPALPGTLVTPGRRSRRFSKLRPFSGRSLITLFWSVPPSSALVVSNGTGVAVTSIFSLNSPGWSTRSCADGLAYFQHDASLLHHFEAVQLRANALVAWNQAGRQIFAGAVGYYGALDAAIDVQNRHRHTWHRRAGLVPDRSQYAA